MSDSYQPFIEPSEITATVSGGTVDVREAPLRPRILKVGAGMTSNTLYLDTSSDRSDALREEFYRLYNDWRARTGHLSTGRFTDAAYYELVGLGREILPLVFREFEKMPSD